MTPPNQISFALALCLVAACTHSLRAEDAAPVAPFKPGFTVGDFRVSPTVVESMTYTDNVRQDPSNAGDWRNEVTGVLDIRSTWTEHMLNLNAVINNRSYAQITQQDSTVYSIIGQGRYDVDPTFNISGAGKFLQSKVDRSNPNAIPGALQSTVSTALGNLQLNYTGSDFTDHLIGNIQHLDFGAAVTPTGASIVELNQNRKQYDLDNYFGKKIAAWGFEPYFYANINKIEYDSTTDPTVRGRNSTGWKIGTGANAQPSPAIKLEYTIGVMRQDYDSAVIGHEISWFGSAGIDWAMSQQDHMRATLQRAFNETNIPDSPGFFMNSATVTYTHAFDAQYSIDLSPTYNRGVVHKYPLTVTQYAGTAGVNDLLRPNISLRAQVLISHTLSNVPLYAYNEHAGTIQLTYMY